MTGAEPAPAWSATPTGAPATADPALDAWVSRLLPAPSSVHITARRLDPVTGATGPALTFTADRLGLGPLDWVRLSADPAETRARAALVARKEWAAVLGGEALTGTVRLEASEDTAPPGPGVLSLGDLTAAADAVRGLLTSARSLSPADLTPPTEAAPIDGFAATAVLGRLQAVETMVSGVLTELRNAREPEALTTSLLAAAALGIAEAVPAFDQGIPPVATLIAQAQLAHARLSARIAAGPIGAADDPATTMAHARQRAADLCGFALPLLIPVSVPALSAVSGGDPATVRAWLHDHARVRPAVAALLRAYDMAETLGADAVLDVRAAHLGADTGTPWAGDSDAPPPGVVDVVMVGRADASRTVTGLALDSWTQTVPDAEIHSALAFHYDRPTASPPHAILVAVTPDATGPGPDTWALDTLLDTVRSTIALAGDRAVAAELVPTSCVQLHD
ncbi:hypothetical protein [Actinoplanes sp. NPDC049599]|uniref:hypothetical protein n=1 Tax=Actinoplanes sp. NPDC049599 TaxID=3363903 RepID=UPI00378FECD1